jgi:ferredoxin--NADP+ reductase
MLTAQQVAELRRQKYNATVIWLRKSHSDLMRLRVLPDKPAREYKPGQYGTLGLGNWEKRADGCQAETLHPGDEEKVVRRAYSLASPILDRNGQLIDGTETGWLEFYVVLVRESGKEAAPALTPRLFALAEGARIHLGEKFTGHYTLDPVQPNDTVVLLATGTGEAPHNTMVWDLLRRGHRGRILSACCVRRRQDLAYLPVHEELMRRFPQYAYISLTTREGAGLVNKVYIQDLLVNGEIERRLGAALRPERTHVYLCGNPRMIGVPEKDPATGARVYPSPPGAIEILEGLGFQTDNPGAKIAGSIHFEEYW